MTSEVLSTDDFYFDDDDRPQCPRCDGAGEVNCHCGGDLCVCDNNGDALCPLCAGDGYVSEATLQKYQQHCREMYEALQKARETKNV